MTIFFPSVAESVENGVDFLAFGQDARLWVPCDLAVRLTRNQQIIDMFSTMGVNHAAKENCMIYCVNRVLGGQKNILVKEI